MADAGTGKSGGSLASSPINTMAAPVAVQRPANALIDLSHVRHMFAGLSGGVFSTLLLHPLDLMKIRFAVSDGKGSDRGNYTSLRSAFRSISDRYGFRGFYQGVVPNCLGAGVSWGVYFFYYNARKKQMMAKNDKHFLGPVDHMLAAGESGFASLVTSNPIWVIKTRMCLQLEDVVMPDHKRYRSMSDAFVKIYKYEGMRGFYKGFTPGMAGVAHGSIQFMAYEELKRIVNVKYKRLPGDAPLTTGEYLGCAALSKIFAASITYPYQVVRARLQDQYKEWGTIRTIVRNMIEYEGVRGFYKGLVPYLLHVMPNICIVFLTYELLVNKMNEPVAAGSSSSQTTTTLKLPVVPITPTPSSSSPASSSARNLANFYNNNSSPPRDGGNSSSLSSATSSTTRNKPTTRDIAIFQHNYNTMMPVGVEQGGSDRERAAGSDTHARDVNLFLRARNHQRPQSSVASSKKRDADESLSRTDDDADVFVVETSGMLDESV